MSPTAADDPTDVGSYFIANYPPFSVWTPQAVDAEADAALSDELVSAEHHG